MSRICELTGKGRLVGNNVSHANNKTKRTFLPNLQNVTLISDALGRGVKLRVSMNGLRSVEHVGGLDNWLLKTSDDKLSLKVRRLKREIAKKQAEATPRPDRRHPSESGISLREIPAFAGMTAHSQRELQQQGPLQRDEIVVRGDPDDRPAALPRHAQRLHIVDRQRRLRARRPRCPRSSRPARRPRASATASLAEKPSSQAKRRLSSSSRPSGSRAASVPDSPAGRR